MNSILQAPFEGFSMNDTFNDAGSPDNHTVQYFEMFGSRGIYHNGWTVMTKYSTPRIVGKCLLLMMMYGSYTDLMTGHNQKIL